MKNKFALGLVVGIFCSAILFAGVYYLAENIRTDYDGAGSTGKPTQMEQSDNKPTSEGDSQTEASQETGGTKPSTVEALAKSLIDDKAEYIMKLTEHYFLYDVTQEDYKTAVYRALMAACDDPYSCYYTPEEYKSMMESTGGTYCGIGCLVSQDVKTMLISIVRPFEGSPAAKAGIQAGDIVYKVNGEEVAGQDINLVVSKMKGEENTKVTITMYRNGEYLDFEVTRAFIEVETVVTEKMDVNGHKLGMITVTEFDEVTEKQFEQALKDMKKWGAEGLLVDLRDNPGGRLDVVVNMLDELLPEGLTVYMKDKNGEREEYSSDSKYYDIPMAVIINGNSASASEIFAGAVQDYQVADVVGTQSFGKGIVQSVIPISDGSAIKMTIADYYTPLGRNIHGVGITPDIVVELPEGKNASTVERENDTQLQAAIEAVLRQIGE